MSNTNSKYIFVTGATGNLGGAAARALLKNNFIVKALTRNTTNPKAIALQKAGAEIIEGDLNDTATYKKYLNGVDGIFSLQTFENGIEKEILQGESLANLAKETGIGHFVYSSVSGADLNTGVPHWESKLKVENHIKSIGLSYTIIRPVSLYENFLIPHVKKNILKGKLVYPINGNIPQQFISAEDIGLISAGIFAEPGKYTGRTITAASELMDLDKAAKIFSKLIGRDIVFKKLPMFIARIFLGKNIYKMFEWINENNAVFVKDLESFKKEFPGIMNLEEWIQLNF